MAERDLNLFSGTSCHAEVTITAVQHESGIDSVTSVSGRVPLDQIRRFPAKAAGMRPGPRLGPY